MNNRQTHPALLMLILLAHLVLFWLLARQRLEVVKARPDTRERITYLELIRPPQPTAPPPPAVPHPRARPVDAPVHAVRPPTASVVTSAPAPVAAAAPVAEPAPTPAPPAPHHLSTFDIIEQAKADMPRIERELRNNVPTRLTLDKNSMRYKLEHGIADAYVGGDQRVTVDFYTSADNVHYMRFTKQGKVWCTMHGGPVSLASAMGHDGGDSKVNCPPPDSGWKDMPWVN